MNIRQSGVAVCDRIKQMFEDGECDHLSATDIERVLTSVAESKYLTGEEAVAYTGLSQTKFYKLKKEGLISSSVKLKGFPKPLYLKSELDNDMKCIFNSKDDRVKNITRAGSAEVKIKRRFLK